MLHALLNVHIHTPFARRSFTYSPQESTSVSFHGTYAPFVFILLRTLLHRRTCQPFSFHILPRSLRKTPGVGHPLLPCDLRALRPPRSDRGAKTHPRLRPTCPRSPSIVYRAAKGP